MLLGVKVGGIDGLSVVGGLVVGTSVGALLGNSVGDNDGRSEGALLGAREGGFEGTGVSAAVGLLQKNATSASMQEPCGTAPQGWTEPQRAAFASSRPHGRPHTEGQRLGKQRGGRLSHGPRGTSVRKACFRYTIRCHEARRTVARS